MLYHEAAVANLLEVSGLDMRRQLAHMSDAVLIPDFKLECTAASILLAPSAGVSCTTTTRTAHKSIRSHKPGCCAVASLSLRPQWLNRVDNAQLSGPELPEHMQGCIAGLVPP